MFVYTELNLVQNTSIGSNPTCYEHIKISWELRKCLQDWRQSKAARFVAENKYEMCH